MILGHIQYNTNHIALQNLTLQHLVKLDEYYDNDDRSEIVIQGYDDMAHPESKAGNFYPIRFKQFYFYDAPAAEI